MYVFQAGVTSAVLHLAISQEICWLDKFHQTSHLEQSSQVVPSLPFPSKSPEKRNQKSVDDLKHMPLTAQEKTSTTTDLLTTSASGDRLLKFLTMFMKVLWSYQKGIETTWCNNSHGFLESHWSCRFHQHAVPVFRRRTFVPFVWAEKKRAGKSLDRKEKPATVSCTVFIMF